MKTHRVRVRLVAECEVEIDVRADDDEDPSDLTKAERANAISLATPRAIHWEVDEAWVVSDAHEKVEP